MIGDICYADGCEYVVIFDGRQSLIGERSRLPLGPNEVGADNERNAMRRATRRYGAKQQQGGERRVEWNRRAKAELHELGWN